MSSRGRGRNSGRRGKRGRKPSNSTCGGRNRQPSINNAEGENEDLVNEKKGGSKKFKIIDPLILAESTSSSRNLVTSVNDFAYELYKARIQYENECPGNVVCSPLCVHLIISMATCGALDFTTEKLMIALRMHATFDIRYYMPDFQRLLDKLSWDKYNERFQCNDKLCIANQTFVHKELVTKLQNEFRSKLKSHFQCGCTRIDFTDKDNYPKIIENWCQKQTDAGVKNINLSSVGFDGPPTAVMFVNSIYFKFCWKYPFDVLDTEMLPFRVNQNKTVNVPTMNQEGYFSYLEPSFLDVLVISIPYEIEGAHMLIIMPNKINGLTNVQSKVYAVDLFAKLVPHKCHLYLPRFNIANNCDLGNAVRALGMSHMFEHEKAVFDGIIRRLRVPPLCANRVLQKCCICVNEKGTETATSSCKIVNIDQENRRKIQEVNKICINKPFLYLIRHKDIILFIGRVYNPIE